MIVNSAGISFEVPADLVLLKYMGEMCAVRCANDAVIIVCSVVFAILYHFVTFILFNVPAE